MSRPSRNTQSGQAILGAVIFFLAGSFIVLSAVASPVLRDTRAVRNLTSSKIIYASAEGALEDALYRAINNKTITNPFTVTVGSTSVTVSSQDVLTDKVITAVGIQDGRVRKVQISLAQGEGASFNAGLQAGEGGISMINTSSVLGNVYSNGPITGANSNITYGSIVSAGPTGLISGVHATGTAYAHTIQNSTIDKDAYYQSISGTTVGGTSYPGSSDLATTSLPIADSLVATWEVDAEAGGIISSPCPYAITGTITIGAKKINCDVTISNSAVVTLTGPLWIVGNLSVGTGAAVNVAASVGNRSVAIVVDDPSNRSTGSTISLSNNISFSGNGNANSFILLLSQNNSAETGGSNLAIDFANKASGDLMLYAGHGKISISNNTSATSPIRTVTAYRVALSNSAQVVYKVGLASLIFTDGPSGGYSIQSWSETQ